MQAGRDGHTIPYLVIWTCLAMLLKRIGFSKSFVPNRLYIYIYIPRIQVFIYIYIYHNFNQAHFGCLTGGYSVNLFTGFYVSG